MLEILVLWILTRRIGAIVEQKGHRSGWFRALAVALWFAGELMGALAGGLIAQGRGLLTGYVFALAGAAVGAAIAWGAASQPVFSYRWWRVAASLLALGGFFVLASLAIDDTKPAMPVAIVSAFIAILLATVLIQDVLDRRRIRSVLLLVATGAWGIVALLHAGPGAYLYDVWEAPIYERLMLFTLGVSAVGALWSIVHPLLSRSIPAGLLIEQPGAQGGQLMVSPDQAPSEPPAASHIAALRSDACPKCGARINPTDQNCPACRINLAWARQHLNELQAYITT